MMAFTACLNSTPPKTLPLLYLQVSLQTFPGPASGALFKIKDLSYHHQKLAYKFTTQVPGLYAT